MAQDPKKYPLDEHTPKIKSGRPSKYRKKYCKSIIEFFDRPHFITKVIKHTSTKGKEWTREERVANPVPLMCEFAHSIKLYHSTILDWVKQYSDFHEAFIHAQNLQLAHLNAVTGTNSYNAYWAVFMAKNISAWRDRKDVEHTGQVGLNLFVDKMIQSTTEAEADEAAVLRPSLN